MLRSIGSLNSPVSFSDVKDLGENPSGAINTQEAGKRATFG